MDGVNEREKPERNHEQKLERKEWKEMSDRQKEREREREGMGGWKRTFERKKEN